MKIVKKLNMFCLLLLSVAMLSSCAKDREEKFLQGHGRDFEKVEDYTGGSFFVDTGDQLRAANLSVAEKLIVEPGVAKVNNLGLVQIKDTNAKLLGEIPFRGLPNTKYTIEYKLSPKYLKLYKVAPEEQIPFDEKTYGTLRPDGQWEIPLVGYEVDYYTHERQRNQYEEEGQYLVEVPVEDPSKAKYLKIRRLTRKVFDAITKVDTYPADMIVGDYYMSLQDVAVGFENFRSIAGGQLYARKVRVVKRNEGYRIYDIGVDDRVDDSKLENLTAHWTIKATWKDYQVADAGSDKGLHEESVSSAQLLDRKYAQISFTSIVNAPYTEQDPFTGEVYTVTPNFELTDLSFGEDHWSMTVYDVDSQVMRRISFLEAKDRGYDRKVYYKEDEKIFGYFKSVPAKLKTSDIFHDDQIEDLQLINRMNPKKDIVFYLSDQSPDWTIPVAQAAVDAWDKAFNDPETGAGLGVRVRFDSSKKVRLNDLRYNIINMVDSIFANGLLGYGPSIADPKTGEIISGTANVYIGTYRSLFADLIRAYIKTETLDRELSLNIPKVDQEALLAALTDAKSPLLPAPTKGFYRPSTTDDPTVSYIAENCQAVNSYIEGFSSSTSIDFDTLKNAVEECTQIVLKKYLGPTLVHEIGHTIGLRHNFYASADRPNWLSADEADSGTEEKSSSIMDYFMSEQEPIFQPGKYDIAAVAFSYGSKVETKTGSFVEVAENGPIKASIVDSARRPYLYCTDEQARGWGGHEKEILCSLFDLGSTVTEVLENYISQAEMNFGRYYYRDGRISQRTPLAHMARATSFAKQAYIEWREHLSREVVGTENRFLGEYDEKAFREMLKTSSGSEKFNDLFTASRMAFSYLKHVSELPDRYCVVNVGERKELLALSKVSTYYAGQAHEYVSNCQDETVKKYMNARHMTLDTTMGENGEVGYFHGAVRFSLDKDDVNKKPDVLGVGPAQGAALKAIFDRPSGHGKTKVAFFDEPDIRAALTAQAWERISTGYKIPELGEQLFENFAFQKSDLNVMVSGIKDSRIVPGDPIITRQREIAYEYDSVSDKDKLEEYLAEGAFAYQNSPKKYMVVEDEVANSEAMKVVDTIAALDAEIFSLQFQTVMEDLEEQLSFLAESENGEIGGEDVKSAVSTLRANLRFAEAEFPLVRELRSELIAPFREGNTFQAQGDDNQQFQTLAENFRKQAEAHLQSTESVLNVDERIEELEARKSSLKGWLNDK